MIENAIAAMFWVGIASFILVISAVAIAAYLFGKHRGEYEDRDRRFKQGYKAGQREDPKSVYVRIRPEDHVRSNDWHGVVKNAPTDGSPTPIHEGRNAVGDTPFGETAYEISVVPGSEDVPEDFTEEAEPRDGDGEAESR